MGTLTIPKASVAPQTEKQDEEKPRLSFASMYKHLTDEQPSKKRGWIHRTATIIGALVAVGGLIFSVWSATPNSGYGVHATLVGFGLEILGLAGLMFLGQSHRAWRRQTSSHDDMADYDALHAACDRTIEWLSRFDLSNIASMRSTLEEQQRARDMASAWMFGSAEKLGVLPVLAAVVVQGLSIARPTGLAGSVVSGLAVGATLAYCYITFALTRARVRDQRLAWLMMSAENLRRSGESSEVQPTGDITPK